MPYDPNSDNAMFGKVMTRLDNQDKTLADILTEVRKTNGRVSRIETEREVEKGKIAIISAGVSGAVGVAVWVLNHLAS